MAAETARTRRLRSDHAKVLALVEASRGTWTLENSLGQPPAQYVLLCRYKSLERLEGTEAVFRNEHRVEIKIPSGYPLEPPVVRLMTPLFHPHVFSNGLVCLGSRWQVGEGLDHLLARIGAILRFEPAYLDYKSPANLAAAHWAAAHRSEFPLEPDAPPAGQEDERPRELEWKDLGQRPSSET